MTKAVGYIASFEDELSSFGAWLKGIMKTLYLLVKGSSILKPVAYCSTEVVEPYLLNYKALPSVLKSTQYL
jgi:hypothetical protein